MSVSSQFPQLSLTEVFKRIDVGVTVITPNRRLALALKDKFDTYQASQDLFAWRSADILPFTSFVERIYQDTLYSEQATELPILLTSAQEQVLWESIIQSSDIGKVLLTIPQTAQWVREAWQLAHAWQLISQLKRFALNEDGKAFQQWVQCYERITERARQTDVARISDLLVASYANLEIRKPECLICYGFDIFTPQQITFLTELVATDCAVVQAHSVCHEQSSSKTIRRHACVDSRDEIYQAAVWARVRIETNRAACIGVVVPELAKHRSTILRIFNSVMVPDVEHALPSATRRMMPFNISLGLPLTSYPLIDTAFLVLELFGQEIEFERVSRLLRSPFLAGSETEMCGRAQLDAQIRKHAEPFISLEQLLVLTSIETDAVNCPVLMQCLSALVVLRQENLSGAQSHTSFVQIISEVLKAIGFPGERGLDSAEYQTAKKWQELVAGFSALDCVLIHTGYVEAVRRLNRMATEILFQPETPEVPIQILGVLEAAGMTFDHLWVMGLSDESWPLRPRPNPFLSIELQQIAKLPFGSTLESFVYSRKITEGWLASADEVILSHPRHSDDRDAHGLEPSSLIKQLAVSEVVLPVYANHRDCIISTGKLEYCVDAHAPPLDLVAAQNTGIRGGTAVIKDFAACPFRAWAKHRLDVESLSAPHSGLDAMERGSLVHQVLAQVWTQLCTKSALDTISGDNLDNMLQSAAARAIQRLKRVRPSVLSGRFAIIEKRRLVHLVHEWLREEGQRSHFTVIATEDKRTIEIAGLTLNTCLDRVDELDDGRRIVIDYKTQWQSIGSMIGARPDEPQLPLYLVMAEPDASAVAFAKVKRGHIGFAAIARDEDLLPGVKALSESQLRSQYHSWDELVATWRADLAMLATGFINGDAQVNPKNFPQTCNYCDMQPFCRIHERIDAAATERGDKE